MNDTERLNQSIKELNSQIEKTIQSELSKDNQQKEEYINDVTDKLKKTIIRHIEVNEHKLWGKIQFIKVITLLAFISSVISLIFVFKIYFYIT